MCTFNETEVALARNSLEMQISGVHLVRICYNGLIEHHCTSWFLEGLCGGCTCKQSAVWILPFPLQN